MAARIPYDSLTLRAVADELRRSLAEGVVQHVAQPAETDVVLTVRSRGRNGMLLLSCDASFARAHMTSIRRPNPPSPPAFCMLCRKYLEGARLTAVEQRGFDRILDLRFDGPMGDDLTLTAELMGKHSNLILWSGDGLVLDAAKRISRRLSRHREVLPGRAYVAPPAQEDRADPFAATPAELAAIEPAWPRDHEARAAVLMGHFAGLSPFLAEELVLRAERASLPEAWDAVIGAAARGEWSPVLVRNERGEPAGAYPFAIVQVPADRQHARDSIDTALDHFYGIALPRSQADAARREVEGALNAAIKARRRQEESLAKALAEAGRAEEYRTAGELLLANLHAVPAEAASVVVADYYQPDGAERTISLDATLSPRENADAYFRRYRKAKEGADALRQQLERVADERRRLEDGQRRLAEAQDAEAVASLRTELTAGGLLRPQPRAAGPGGSQAEPEFGGYRIRSFHTPEGWEILLGENDQANGYLVTRVAAPDDLWLHVRANTSAHVVIRTRRNPAAVPHAVIRQAALMAARHSAAKHSSSVPVDYTLRKYVRRPRGAAPGAVLYQHEKTIHVDPTEGR